MGLNKLTIPPPPSNCCEASNSSNSADRQRSQHVPVSTGQGRAFVLELGQWGRLGLVWGLGLAIHFILIMTSHSLEEGMCRGH